MSFIVKKKISGKEYFYLRESKRVGGKVKAVTICYLGKTKKEAEEKKKEIEEGLKNKEVIQKDKMVEEKEQKELTIEDVASFCKRKGFIFRSSDIYGGFAGFWDYGPLGVELFNNVKKEWWNWFVESREDMEGIDCSIISHPRTWKASGHLTSFKDIAVVCRKCKKSTKIDVSEKGKVKCDCGGEYEEQGEFNLLFKTQVGALNAGDAYLRGETAQGMFMNFKQVMEASRQKLPFGIAQIGRCFRNEIAPRDFLFRSREFHIGEFEFFINPQETKCPLLDKEHLNVKLNLLDAETQEKGEEDLKLYTIGKMLKANKFGEWHAYWLAEQVMFFLDLGLDEDKIKVREHTKGELSHYSSATFDLDYLYPFGSKELAGNANRGQYDLTQHEKESKQKMEVFDSITNEKVIPRVIEPTFGMERVFLAVLVNSYYYDKKRDNIILKIPAKLAPYKAAVLPIIKKGEQGKIAKEVYDDIRKMFHCFWDEGGSIGRRYSRQDEIGTPMCITIDEQSLKDKTVTIRDRDTTRQVRVKIKELREVVRKVVEGESILKLGKEVKTRVK